jgi:hypothetical protein
MKKTLFLILSSLFISKAFAFQASCDLKLSPHCGAENLSTIHYHVEKLDNYLLESIKNNPENNLRASIIRSIERGLELSFIWEPLNGYLNVIQHEFFGHGYRIRDFGKNIVSINEYKILAPYPFGNGGGSTSFYIKKITPFYESAISIAGTEATSILAREIKLNWLKNGSINPLQASLYLESLHDLTFYTSLTHYEDLFSDSGNDIASYVSSLSQIYPVSPLFLFTLKNQAKINLLDPFTFYSIYSFFKYIVCGKATSIPMIPIKGYSYLPSFRLGLAPFGPEIYFENYLCNNNGPIYLYFKKGTFWENRYFGIGVQAPFIVSLKSNLFFGMKIDFWKQPLILGPDKARQNLKNIFFYDFREEDLKKERFGGSLCILTSYKVKNIPLYFDGAVGYKTAGFVPGESLKQSPLLRIGLSGTF